MSIITIIDSLQIVRSHAFDITPDLLIQGKMVHVFVGLQICLKKKVYMPKIVEHMYCQHGKQSNGSLHPYHFNSFVLEVD